MNNPVGYSGTIIPGDPPTVRPHPPIFKELPHYEDSLLDPVYRVYTAARSRDYLRLLDLHIKNFQENFMDQQSVINFPNIEMVLLEVMQRRRILLLEDIFFLTNRRPDLEQIFSRHRLDLILFLRKVKIISEGYSHFPRNSCDPRINLMVNRLFKEYISAHEIFMHSLPEHSMV